MSGLSSFFLVLSCWLSASGIVLGQVIPVRNGSFEAPHGSEFRMPGWTKWGQGATPDIQPGQWSVRQPPARGTSFVGLITREDGSAEGVQQKLGSGLKAGRCYYFTVALARDTSYSGFHFPLSLRVRGKKGAKGKVFDLAMTPMVRATTWSYFTIEFTPVSDTDYLILEASWAPGVSRRYRGNILVDDMSEIKPCLRAGLLTTFPEEG